MAQLRPFPTDPRLTGIAIAYRNNEMVADRILPRVPVPKREFRWLKFDRAERMTVPETLISRKSVPNEVDFTAQEEAGMVYDRGLDDLVPNDDVAEAAGTGYDPLGLESPIKNINKNTSPTVSTWTAARVAAPVSGNTTSHTWNIQTPTTDPGTVAKEMINEMTGRL